MNSDQLRQFKTIVECGNLTKAAEQLYITQPALSMTLTKLEDEIGKLLFIREGRQLRLTENGEKLLKYASTVTEAIDQAKECFRVPDEVREIRIYRIGGIGAPLLLSGCYDLPDYRLKLKLVHNRETPAIVGQAIAVFIIADERYMNTAVYKGVEKVFLYHQDILLSVHRDDPLADRDEIHITELEGATMIGRPSRLGLNDWISDIERDNRCTISEGIHCDYTFYFTEGPRIMWPYLMSSFGLSIAKQQPYFKDRKTLRVTGEYTGRDVYLWYDNRIKRLIQPYINLIESNAKRVSADDLKACL